MRVRDFLAARGTLLPDTSDRSVPRAQNVLLDAVGLEERETT